eukprot:1282984-Rhodomonas_salina.1
MMRMMMRMMMMMMMMRMMAVVCGMQCAVSCYAVSGILLRAFPGTNGAYGVVQTGLATKLPQLAGLVFIGVFSSAAVYGGRGCFYGACGAVFGVKSQARRGGKMRGASNVGRGAQGEGFGLNMVVGGALAITACVTASSNTFYSKLAGAGAAVKRLVTGGKKGGGGEGAKGASGRY